MKLVRESGSLLGKRSSLIQPDRLPSVFIERELRVSLTAETAAEAVSAARAFESIDGGSLCEREVTRILIDLVRERPKVCVAGAAITPTGE